MNTKIIVSIIAIAIISVGGLMYFTRDTAPIMEEQVSESPITETMPAIEQTVMITYTDEGYVPAEVTIPAGTTITWTNESSRPMWVASAMHPTHVVYDGTSKDEHCNNNAPTSETVFDECVGHPKGSSWSFTFTKTGSWKYHDHITSGKYGSIIVTEATVAGDGADASAI